MNLETKITIYKFTPQVFTLTQCNMVQQIWNTLYIMYSPLRKEYIQDLHYNFSTSSLDKPVAPIINSVGEPTCFK